MPARFFCPRYLLLLLIALTTTLGANAAPPATLGYQGRLASAGGTPVSATVGITFRLYDVPSGGVALWSETQPAVEVDGGNLAVELGKLTPLPATIWGRQLYLGIQVAGDSEMLPRPPLTAAPFALRAAGTMKRTVVVSAEGTPAANGTALLAAVAGITDADAANPVTVELDSGTFDLGSATLVMPPHTTLAGRSQHATLVTSATTGGDPAAAVVLQSNSAARHLTVRNTGVGAVNTDSVVGLAVNDPANTTAPVSGVVLEQVSGESIAATGAAGQRAGLRVCASDVQLLGITGRAEGGQFAMGLRSDCAASTGLLIDGALLEARGASDGLRGTYLAGGGLWRNIKVFIDVRPNNGSVYGIRVFANSNDVGAALIDAQVSISGDDLASTTQTAILEGLRVEYDVDLLVERPLILIERARAGAVSGLRALADSAAEDTLKVIDADIRIEAMQDAVLGPGGVFGLRLQGAAPELVRANIDVRCLAPGYNRCHGINQQQPPGPPGTSNTTLQPGRLRLEHGNVLVRHDDPADGSAQSIGMVTIGSSQVLHSTLRVVRSADLELHFVLNQIDGGSNARIHHSTLIAETPSDPANACSIGGQGSAELFGNVLVGNTGCGSPMSFNCAGNVRAGAGFLAAGCP